MATKLAVIFLAVALSTTVLGKPTPDGYSLQVQPPIVAVSPPKTGDSSEENPLTLPAKPDTVSGNDHGSAIHLEEVHFVDDPAAATAMPVPPMRPPGQCPRIYLPVCGSDNRTYNTECELKAAAQLNPGLHKIKSEACEAPQVPTIVN